MKDVKKNMKIFSKSTAKEFLIDLAIAYGGEAIVKKAIEYIPNPTAQIAVRAAVFAGDVYVAMKLTSEERKASLAALYDMIAGKSQQELYDEIMEDLMGIHELNQKLKEQEKDA